MRPSDGTVSWAIGTGDRTDAIGVTVLRDDGSGLSITLSTAAYGVPPHGSAAPVAPPLTDHPLSHNALVELVSRIAGEGVVFPADMLPGPGPTSSGPQTSLAPGSDPCDNAVPAFHECVLVGGVAISTLALVDALAAGGLTVDAGDSHQVLDVDGTSSTSAVLTFHLSDAEGRAGSAAIGVFDSLDEARMFDGTGDPAAGGNLAWCGVAPSGPVPYEWMLADDPTAVCDGVEAADADRTIVVVHDEIDAGAIGATLIRPDGSVVTVSVSQAPLATISAQLTPLGQVPLDQTAIVEALRGVAAAIHGDGVQVEGGDGPSS